MFPFRRWFAAILASVPILAADPVNPAVLKQAAESYLAKQPAKGIPTGIVYRAALDLQKQFVQQVIPKLGPPAGYKVGLVTPAGQQRFGIAHPVRGVLLKQMLLPNNSTVSGKFATRPIVEPDLIVRVKDEGINDAKTIEEAARHLSEVITFIEVADNVFATNAPMDAGVLIAGNVGARAGIIGESRKISDTPEFIEAFRKMALVLQDRSGKELSRASAEGIMGHPLKAVLWLVEDLRKHGGKLQAGDVLSLGSPSPQVTPVPGEKYTLIYEGLPGGPIRASVSVE
jgi:2-keto-4-pentenoate hydratase